MSKRKFPKRLFVMPDYYPNYFSYRNAHSDYLQFFDGVDYFPEVMDFTKDHALFLEGGRDISPEIYGEKYGKWTQHPSNARRDREEMEYLTKALSFENPVMGICRGAQLSCAFLGGKLIQEVENHHQPHPLEVEGGGYFNSGKSSSHHQMMYPWPIPKNEWKLLMWSPKGWSKCGYLDGLNEQIRPLPDDFVEPEAIFFSKAKILAIQGHPEYVNQNHVFTDQCLKFFRKYILGDK